MNPGTPVSGRQLELEIASFAAKAKLHRAMLEAAQEKDIQERTFMSKAWEVLCISAGIPESDPRRRDVVPLLQCMRDFNKAQEDIFRVQLLELESQVKIREAMLEEARRNSSRILVPEPGSRIVE